MRLIAGLAIDPAALHIEQWVELLKLCDSDAVVHERLPFAAEEVVRRLGPNGSNVIPDLVKRMAAAVAGREDYPAGASGYPGGRLAGLVAEAFGRFGTSEDGVYEELVAAVEVGLARTAALGALASIGDRSLEALPTINRACRQFEIDLYLADATDASPDTEAVRDAVTERGHILATRIGEYGERAQSLGPLLESLLDRYPPPVGAEVATAVLEVGHPSGQAVDVLVSEILDFSPRKPRRDWSRIVRALSARDQVELVHDQLSHWATSDRRVLRSPTKDDELRGVAREAIQSPA
ncbi:MAG: hypothetical protein HYX32_12490 [Actinobacteria bacterium]|nr:hypothetical protein [Actinomycetota bacterium]